MNASTGEGVGIDLVLPPNIDEEMRTSFGGVAISLASAIRDWAAEEGVAAPAIRIMVAGNVLKTGS